MAEAAVPAPHDDPAVRAALRTLRSEDQKDLVVGGLRLVDLVAEFGSPLYVFDGDAIRRRAEA
ncbi:MAG: diaminopimelate decarboxylase, partial [Planctomycetota bacterium]